MSSSLELIELSSEEELEPHLEEIELEEQQEEHEPHEQFGEKIGE